MKSNENRIAWTDDMLLEEAKKYRYYILLYITYIILAQDKVLFIYF